MNMFTWSFDLAASREQLWPLVSDTNRLNKAWGLPEVARVPAAKSGEFSAVMRTSTWGVTSEWVEPPFEWVYPSTLAITRTYTKGVFASILIRIDLEARAEGGTRVVYTLGMEPRTPFGFTGKRFAARAQAALEELLKEYDAAALNGQTMPLPAVAASKAGRADVSISADRLVTYTQALGEQGVAIGLIEKFTEFLRAADDIDAARIRPYALADHWRAPRREVLELCLRATTVGLLTANWDMLCSMCRKPGKSAHNLSAIESHVYCESCGRSNDVDFKHLVELTFEPNPAVRQVAKARYCLSAPSLTPHMLAVQLVAPGAAKEITLTLPEGVYSLLLRGAQFQARVEVVAGALERAELSLSAGSSGASVRVRRGGVLTVNNLFDEPQGLVIMTTAWDDKAVSATEVTSLQIFRDLFGHEALRAGQEISVGSLAILFTDLRGSTKLYREIGDAPAFGLVMNHFDVLKRAIADEQGTIVKTIGDAVMAVFFKPSGAIRAMLRAQRELAQPTREGERPLTLKAGIHYGPCIAVNLNDRLDYFGSTINFAARLEGLSTGEDVIVTQSVLQDPDVAREIVGAGQYQIEEFASVLKGFDNDVFKLARVKNTALQAPVATVQLAAPELAKV